MKRKYISLAALFIAILFMAISCSTEQKAEQSIQAHDILFPSPFALAIDDLGWMSGGSQGEENGPWRLGLKRDLERSDYQALVDIAKGSGIRLQGLFIMAEMDRTNACAKVPSSTRYGSNWDNSHNVGDEQLRIMDLVKEEAAWLEFGLHGVGHEFWVDGIRQRAEYYNLEQNHPWPEKDIREHLDLFVEIMGQYGLTPANGHSFPESFVPCAYSYFWNPDGDPYSLGQVLNEYGVRFANTLFSYIPELNPPDATSGDFDNGVLVIDRYNHGNHWFESASLPKDPIDAFETDIIEAHFANLLATDDFLQANLNDKWIRFFKEVQSKPDKYLAKNTEQFYSQWVLKRFASISSNGVNQLSIDTRNVPEWAFQNGFITNMVLKIAVRDDEVISKATLNGKPIPATAIDEGYAMMYLPPMEAGVHTFEMATGSEWQQAMVINDGTYNVYRLSQEEDVLHYDIRVYGTQEIKINLAEEPGAISSSNPNLSVQSWNYHAENKLLHVELSARNFQGETGRLSIKSAR